MKMASFPIVKDGVRIGAIEVIADGFYIHRIAQRGDWVNSGFTFSNEELGKFLRLVASENGPINGKLWRKLIDQARKK
jgi:hypothetical protein